MENKNFSVLDLVAALAAAASEAASKHTCGEDCGEDCGGDCGGDCGARAKSRAKRACPDFILNTAAPVPVRAIFSLKAEDMVPVLGEDGKPLYEQAPGENSPKKVLKEAKPLENPVLASKVFFDDGTWTLVKNSSEDKVDVEEKTVCGRKVKVATDASKERALAFAVVKRLFGEVDPVTKEARGANLGRRFAAVLKASVDQNERAAAKEAAKNAPSPAERCPKAKQKKAGNKASSSDLADLINAASSLFADIATKIEKNRPAPEAGAEAPAGA